MRALRVVRTAAGAAGLAVCDVPEPKPRPDEVLIRVATVAVNRLDLHVLAGTGLGRSAVLPLTPGLDPAGVVVAQGSDVTRQLTGRRVVVKPNLFCSACDRCAAGQEADCRAQTVLGVNRDGGAAELVTVPASCAFELPDSLDYACATVAVHSVPVALRMLRAAPAIGAGDCVLVTGASGAVGWAAVQLALRAGARVIAVVRGPEKRRLLDTLGAVAVIDAALATPFADQVAAVAPDGITLALDTTGCGEVVSAALRCLGWQGRLVTCSGEAGEVCQFELGPVYRNRQSICGVAAAGVADVRHGLDLVAARAVTPNPAVSVPLDEYAAAYESLINGTRIGKPVLRME